MSSNDQCMFCFSLSPFTNKFLTDLCLFDEMINRFEIGNSSMVLDVLQDTNAIIGGLLVIAMLSSFPLVPDNFDIFVPQEGFARVFAHLLQHDYIPQEDQIVTEHDFGSRTNSRVMILSKREFRIHLTETTTRLPILAILDSHSTLVMNYIAWYGIVSFYPRLTTRGRGVIQRTGPRSQAAIEDYRGHGYYLENQSADPTHYCVAEIRSSFDEDVLFISFLVGDPILFDIKREIIWRLKGRCCDSHHCRGFYMNLGLR